MSFLKLPLPSGTFSSLPQILVNLALSLDEGGIGIFILQAGKQRLGSSKSWSIDNTNSKAQFSLLQNKCENSDLYFKRNCMINSQLR